MARRRFFVDEVRGGRAVIEGDDAHHLTRVLRVETGQKYEISDNEHVYLAEVDAARKDLVSFAVLSQIAADEPLVRVSLYASLIRFERFEVLIEKATELGVERIVAVDAERSEKGLDQAAAKRMARWKRIVREASEQSRRIRLTEISGPVRIKEALTDGVGERLLLDEDAAAAPILRVLAESRAQGAPVSLLAGPEGGWTDRERAAMVQAGWKPVSLGPTILKTETAVIAALAVINAAWQAEACS